MNDKTKPVKPQITTAEVVATITKTCESTSDDKSIGISAALIRDNYNEGKRGAAVIGAARLSDNVGKCVADAYDDKEPSAVDKARGWLTGLMNAAVGAKEDLKVGGTQLVRDVTNGISGGGLDAARDSRKGPSGVPNTPAANL